ncbi:MAG: MarR family transcriptional regulator [Promethearchaeota archaeon]
MDSQESDNSKSLDEKLDKILSTVKTLGTDVKSLKNRISQLEGRIDQKLSIPIESSESKSTERKIDPVNFDELDEHLKRTYEILETAQKPMDASELAERMGRSRSTISYHLNQLEKKEFLEKIPSPKDRSRNVFFRPKGSSFKLINSEK